MHGQLIEYENWKYVIERIAYTEKRGRIENGILNAAAIGATEKYYINKLVRIQNVWQAQVHAFRIDEKTLETFEAHPHQIYRPSKRELNRKFHSLHCVEGPAKKLNCFRFE